MTLFERRYALDPFAQDARNYDVARDGRFLMIKEDIEPVRKVNFVLNWFQELESLERD